MQKTELRTGVAYEYTTGSRWKRFGSNGAMFVLSTSLYKNVWRAGQGEAPYVEYSKGDRLGYQESTGLLVIHFRNAGYSAFTDEALKILSGVTLEQVYENNMRLPADVVAALDVFDGAIQAEVKIVLPRYLKGDWYRLQAEYEADLSAAKVAGEQAMVEAETRHARWEELGRVSESLIGRKPWSFGGPPTGTTETVSLEYLEALVRAVQSAQKDTGVQSDA
jgi:hypothetical protein